ELFLAVGDITGERTAGGIGQAGGGQRLAIGPGRAETETAQRLDVGGDERLEEDARVAGLGIAEGGAGGIAVITYAVENAGGVADGPVECHAVYHRADVAVRQEFADERTFVEGEEGVRLEIFQADGRLHFAEAELQLR